MKKITFLFVGLVWCYSTYCQESKIAVGIELTPTLTSLRGNSEVNSYNPQFSFFAGLSIEYLLSDKYSLKSGFAYERKGAKTEFDYRDNNGNPMELQKIGINFDYIVLPILGSISTSGKNKFYFDAGPYFGFLLSQKDVWEASGTLPERTFDHTDVTKKIDVGLSLGFGLKIPIKTHLSINAGLKGNVGLINTSKYLAVDNSSVRTISLGLQLSLKYKL